MEYQVVDVFAERPLEGNPLTVFPEAGDLPAGLMQALARETNHSETTFVTDPATDAAVPTRIFTPQTELPFAGHPTLGTAFVTGAEALQLAVGRIPVARDGGRLWMQQNPVELGPRLDAGAMAGALGVEVLEATVASTGTPVALAEVTDSDALRAASLDVRRYAGPEVAGVYVFTTDSDHDVHARFFADFVGIKEDAATGGAAGPLAGFLHSEGRLQEERIIHQGIEMQRPSRLHIRGTADGPEVGGKVQRVARGRFELD